MTHSKYLIILILLILPSFLLSQTPKKDLTKLSYDDLHNLYFDNDKDQTKQLEYAQAYLIKANKENIPIRKARANYEFALLYYKSDINKAIMYLDSVIKYSQNSGDRSFPVAAYCEKADFLKMQYKFKEAMDNYNMAEKIALKTNTDYYYVVREYIGTTKSENLGDYNEALEIYKECYRYYKNKDVRSSRYSGRYQSIIFGLADCHKSLQNTDSTTYYNKLGYRESQITKNEEYKYLFVLNEGANQVLKKNYKEALDSINKALPKMIEYNNVDNVLAAYFYLGKAYDGLGKKTIAAENFMKVDSIYKVTGEISTEFIDGYPYLITYYKNQSDKENQLKYITAYMTIDSTLQKNYKELNKLVNKEYDTPRLISEKESLIESLNSEQTKAHWGLGILFLTTIVLSGFGLYQYQLKKRYRFRFEKIIDQSLGVKDNQIEKNKIQITNRNNIVKIEDIGIGEELINQILEKLNRFENDRGYLEGSITVQTLSTIFLTNSKYVSKIVNTHKGKSFIQYINDLRIEYAITQLKENSKLRKYTIQALAMEFGFNNAESFSAAFYKKTGLKPTYFIKELDVVK